MGKVFGSSCLVAGTAIGAGMLALPMVLAPAGLCQAISLMIGVWMLAYYSALLGSELNLRAAIPLPIGALARRFSGRKAELIGQASFMLLCYALLSAYLDGGSSILVSLLHAIPAAPDSEPKTLLHIIAAGIGLLLLLSMKWIDYINRLLFTVMIAILILSMAILMGLINPAIDISPVLQSGSPLTLAKTLPIVFTSFGFQIIFHTISAYLDMDATKIRRAFFFGSLLPAILYIGWTVISLVFIASHQPELFAILKIKSLDVGDFIYILSQASSFPALKLLAWVLSVLAIFTSAIGVGLGLSHTWQALIKNRLFSIVLAVAPPYLVANQIPEAFIQALGFAGMILVIIALLLPMYLLYQSDSIAGTYYKILENKLIRLLVILASMGIMLIEFLNLLKWL